MKDKSALAVLIGKVEIHFLSLLLLGAVIFLDRSLMLFLFLGAVAAHEAGHIWAMRLCGQSLNKVSVLPFGVKISLSDHSVLSYRQEVFIALAGPLVNLALFFSCVLTEHLGATFEGLPLFAFSNLLLFILNMLPAVPLDGGRALQACLLGKIDFDRVQQIMLGLSAFFYFLLCFLGFFILTVTGYNFSLILLALWFLFILFFKSG